MIIAWHMDQTVIKRTTDRALHGARRSNCISVATSLSGFRRALHGRVDQKHKFPRFPLDRLPVAPFTGAWIERLTVVVFWVASSRAPAMWMFCER